MRHPKALLAVVLSCAVLWAAASGPAAADRGALALIRIPKGATLPLKTLARLQLDIRQDLGSCLLALADAGDLALLRRGGIRYAIISRDAARREILLVDTSRPGALDALRAAGHAVVVEAGAAVFWTDQGSAAEAVPAGLPRKVLPARRLPLQLRTPPAGTPAPAAVSAEDPLIEAIVANVTPADLAAEVQTLQDFQTRYASTTNCEAAGESLYSSFSALGLDDVHFEPFAFSTGYASRNVVAEKTGETFPDDVLIICSHYDSYSPSRLTLAPGADDNATGTAAVLEAARVLAPYPLDYTVRFIAFSAEEWGLWGSRAYADAARAAGDNIVGVINLDMIGYADATPEDLQIIVNSGSAWLADLFAAAGPNYGPVTATKMVDQTIVYSDHSPFWDNGYPALLAIEDYPLNNPYYHQTTDTLDRLNLDFYTAAARASIGLLAELAQPIKDGHPGTPARLNAEWESYSSLFKTLSFINLSWNAQADAAGYNVYRTRSSHLNYVKINDAPVTGTSFTDETVNAGGEYYYVLTAVGPTGLESNHSRENTWGAHAAAAAVPGASRVRALTPRMLRGIR